jgi:hypothetical protein
MCYIVKAEIVIANYFAECDSSELELSRLVDIKNEIEQTFKDEGKILFVDTTRSSIFSAINSNPKYFFFDHDKEMIKFNTSQRKTLYEDVYCIFNAKLNLKIKFHFLGILEDILEKYSLSSIPTK